MPLEDLDPFPLHQQTVPWWNLTARLCHFLSHSPNPLKSEHGKLQKVQEMNSPKNITKKALQSRNTSFVLPESLNLSSDTTDGQDLLSRSTDVLVVKFTGACLIGLAELPQKSLGLVSLREKLRNGISGSGALGFFAYSSIRNTHGFCQQHSLSLRKNMPWWKRTDFLMWSQNYSKCQAFKSRKIPSHFFFRKSIHKHPSFLPRASVAHGSLSSRGSPKWSRWCPGRIYLYKRNGKLSVCGLVSPGRQLLET